MTAFYRGVLTEFASLKGLRYRHFNSQRAQFQSAVKQGQYDCASVNNSCFCIELQADDRVSHFVRDPRDLIVSGYHYHKWCVEPWAIRQPYRRALEFESDPLFRKWMPVKSWPAGKSYQQFLNSLDKERGLILEMIWRKPVFTRMREWDFTHPRILEMKYEDIIGNETGKFGELFDHYELNAGWRDDWLAIVAARSIRNLKTGEKQHVRNGQSRQFRSEFTADVMTEFNIHYADLLHKLGYQIETTTIQAVDRREQAKPAGVPSEMVS